MLHGFHFQCVGFSSHFVGLSTLSYFCGFFWVGVSNPFGGVRENREKKTKHVLLSHKDASWGHDWRLHQPLFSSCDPVKIQTRFDNCRGWSSIRYFFKFKIPSLDSRQQIQKKKKSNHTGGNRYHTNPWTCGISILISFTHHGTKQNDFRHLPLGSHSSSCS